MIHVPVLVNRSTRRSANHPKNDQLSSNLGTRSPSVELGPNTSTNLELNNAWFWEGRTRPLNHFLKLSLGTWDGETAECSSEEHVQQLEKSVRSDGRGDSTDLLLIGFGGEIILTAYTIPDSRSRTSAGVDPCGSHYKYLRKEKS
ncbi:hypothetical protein R3P38DRAFT_2805043 [Favolaschia claudopus]|uniref:Uncharacterized protein n=1 Tax=Favolaschia claudopus TaxID=2862362 RepID=A0AAV9ZP96_9AGAR